MIQNGPKPFFHPVNCRRIEAYEWYEGNAHLDHENEEKINDESNEESNEESKPKGKRTKKEEE